MTNDGFEDAFHGEYREIVPNERLVYAEVFEGMPAGDGDDGTLNTITLTEKDGRTTAIILTEAGTRQVRDAIIDSGMEGGCRTRSTCSKRWRSHLPRDVDETQKGQGPPRRTLLGGPGSTGIQA